MRMLSILAFSFYYGSLSVFFIVSSWFLWTMKLCPWMQVDLSAYISGCSCSAPLCSQACVTANGWMKALCFLDSCSCETVRFVYAGVWDIPLIREEHIHSWMSSLLGQRGKTYGLFTATHHYVKQKQSRIALKIFRVITYAIINLGSDSWRVLQVQLVEN